MTTHQYCTFIVNDSLFGVRVEFVQELLRKQRMTPVPLAPRGLSGLINLRGQIVPAVEARERLWLPPRLPSEPAMNVVLLTAAGPVALVVDAIGDVLELADESFETIPETVRDAGKEFILAVCRLESRLLFILDAPALTGASAKESKDAGPLH